MGLDMFLSERIYIGAKYNHNKIDGTINITKDGKLIDIPLNRVEEITLNKGYWRKANHIHNWFVENIQDNIDDCKEYYAPIDKLRQLKSVCGQVKKSLDESKMDESGIYINTSVAEELLPTKSGPFFGGTDYDEYYYETLDDTIKILSELNEKYDYYYTSSW